MAEPYNQYQSNCNPQCSNPSVGNAPLGGGVSNSNGVSYVDQRNPNGVPQNVFYVNSQSFPVGGQPMYVQKEPEFHWMSILAFILSILFGTSLIGLILAIIDLVIHKEYKHGLSIAAIVISGVYILCTVNLFWIALL